MEDLFTFYQSRPMPAIMTVPTPLSTVQSQQLLPLTSCIAMIRFKIVALSFGFVKIGCEKTANPQCLRINSYCNFK